MKRLRITLSAVALLLAAGISQAQAPQRRGGGFGGGGLLGLTQIPAVQTELKLDPTEIDLLKQLSDEARQKARQAFQGGGFGNFQNLSDEERRKQFTAMREQFDKTRVENDKAVAGILDAKQLARLKQLEIQQLGLRGLERKDIQTALKLTPAQQTQVKSAIEGERDAFGAAFRNGANQNQSPEERRAAFTKLRTETDTKLSAILTADQKKQYEAMKGTEFKFPDRGA